MMLKSHILLYWITLNKCVSLDETLKKVSAETYHFLNKECTEKVHPKGDGEAINFVSYERTNADYDL